MSGELRARTLICFSDGWLNQRTVLSQKEEVGRKGNDTILLYIPHEMD